MAKPQMLCRLTEGKLLSSFGHFVETWNWIVDCLDNLKGDKDADPEEGSIKVEGLDNGRPVVKGGGGGGSSISADETFNVITAIQFDGEWIQIKTREAVVENGYVTKFGEETEWTNAISTSPLV